MASSQLGPYRQYLTFWFWFWKDKLFQKPKKKKGIFLEFENIEEEKVKMCLGQINRCDFSI